MIMTFISNVKCKQSKQRSMTSPDPMEMWPFHTSLHSFHKHLLKNLLSEKYNIVIVVIQEPVFQKHADGL